MRSWLGAYLFLSRTILIQSPRPVPLLRGVGEADWPLFHHVGWLFRVLTKKIVYKIVLIIISCDENANPGWKKPKCLNGSFCTSAVERLLTIGPFKLGIKSWTPGILETFSSILSHFYCSKHNTCSFYLTTAFKAIINDARLGHPTILASYSWTP